MKTKIFAAALAALTLGAALPAAAQDYRRGDDYRYQQDYRRGPPPITIRNSAGRYFTFDRNDRLFSRLVARPYNFQPGLTYIYSNRCERRGCLVTVMRNRRVVDRYYAAPLPRFFESNWRDDRDGRWDDRDGRRDDRDGRWDDNDRNRGDRDWNDDQLEGGPNRR